MNTSQIKSFAIRSRNLLKEGVIQRFKILGFDADGNPTKGMPTRVEGGATLFDGEFMSEVFYDQWMSLYRHVQQVGVKEAYEEAAYTWFNRLVAIRIMQKNGFIDPVLAYANADARIPRIVADARAGHIGTQLVPADRERLRELLMDDTRLNEQFAVLIDNYCRFNQVIFNCFGGIEQYISLLLPDNILAPGGFVDLLNHTTYITDDDYKQSELIGWLYQFYISEKKDEVFDGFKRGKKAEAEDIPAATQIFTPNWIVKYMVQNTLGRIYLDNNPYSELKSEMKYLVEPAEPTPKDAILKLENLEDYKLMDNACGSGHILVEGFDLFYKMYLEEAYSSRTAIENIFRKNLIGIDIDTRAKQLATFALLMKAAKVDPSFLDCKVMPRVLDMPGHSFTKPMYELLREFYMGEDRTVLEETKKVFDLLEQADNLGSIMKFDLSAKTRREMALRYKEWEEILSKGNTLSHSDVMTILPSIALILALTDKYSSVVTNPPYMGAGNMNASLYSYVLKNYADAKADLFAVFMTVNNGLLVPKGKAGMINMQNWMFLSAFEKLRSSLLLDYQFESIIHLGPRTFEELSGEVVQSVAFVLGNYRPCSFVTCYRLVKGNNSEEKSSMFLSQERNGISIVYRRIDQNRFEDIPNGRICYWLPKKNFDIFTGDKIGSIAEPREGMTTAGNDVFLRLWHEVSHKAIGLGLSRSEAAASSKKWFPYAKGGTYRKWYGNQDYVVDWENDGYAIQHNIDPVSKRLRSHNYNLDYIFLPCISASRMNNSMRYYPKGFLCDSTGTPTYCRHNIFEILGIITSKVADYFLDIFNPTTVIQPGDICSLPYVTGWDVSIVNDTIETSKKDWDAHETSWNFKENELVRIYKENHGDGLFMDANRLADIVTLYIEYWTAQFNQLHANEEDLNRQFIEIYGLQDELTPEVPLGEITILHQGEISIDNTSVVWHNDVLVKQLLSYAIGCMVGRYRLDRPGLHIAYPNPSAKDIEPYDFQGEKFEIDDDGIIPLLSRDCPFDDNAYNRVVKFVSQVFGDSFLNENLNFIESALGKSVEDYLVKDFWKDHKKMYSNRPIYWLFSSKKGAFQCLTYMHRMNPFTAEQVRSKYLLPYIDYLKNRILEDTERAASLSTVERRALDKMQKALDECLEYEERLHNVADSQIGFDLDDGVVVNYAKFGDILAKIK